MANHLTPKSSPKEIGMDRDEVVRICIEEDVPIYHGKIDKTLFQASLEAVGRRASSAVLADDSAAAPAVAPCSSTTSCSPLGDRRRRASGSANTS